SHSGTVNSHTNPLSPPIVPSRSSSSSSSSLLLSSLLFTDSRLQQRLAVAARKQYTTQCARRYHTRTPGATNPHQCTRDPLLLSSPLPLLPSSLRPRPSDRPSRPSTHKHTAKDAAGG